MSPSHPKGLPGGPKFAKTNESKHQADQLDSDLCGLFGQACVRGYDPTVPKVRGHAVVPYTDQVSEQHAVGNDVADAAAKV